MTSFQKLLVVVAFMPVAALALPMAAQDQIVLATDAYTWKADSVIQGEYAAWAVSPTEIRSTYHARPGYFMPVEQTWSLKNDISAYPRLKTSQGLLQAVYNMGLDEMVNAVEPDTTLRTGKEWAGVWTRDVSYSIILAMAALQPEASMISLMKKVNAEGQIIQDTGSGGAWPISTDRLVWALAAWEIYKVTGSRQWLEKVYPIVERSVAKDRLTVLDADGLLKGETSFIDWREQSYPKWMQTADIAQSVAMSTNMVYAASLQVLSEMAASLGKPAEAKDYAARAEEVRKKINDTFWLEDEGYYGMYLYGQDFPVMNPRAETLGESLSILYDIAPAERARRITESNPVTPFGAAIFFPQIADMPNYHNNALWPFVSSYWALANAMAGNEQGTLEAMGAVVRPAALFATNKENFNLDNGDIFTELNSSNMLWSLSGNLALTQQILFGIHFEPDGLRIAPFVPKALADTRVLENFPYRGARLDIEVEGYGSEVKSLTLNGKALDPAAVIPAKELRKGGRIMVRMADNDIAPMKVNRRANLKAPLTPSTRFAEIAGKKLLEWNPIEYIAAYEVIHDGKPVGTTRQTSWPIDVEGTWQVVGIASDGTRSFASQPLSNRSQVWIQPQEEVSVMVSPEISYRPEKAVEGFTGHGFAETDHERRKVVFSLPEGLEEGVYSAALRYANGNGPVNTENKAAVRGVTVGGKQTGVPATIVMPHRGVANWDDWGLSNTVRLRLSPSDTTVEVDFLPEIHENMNLATNHALIDALMLTRIGD